MPVITWEQEKVRVAYKLIIIDCNAPAHLIVFFSSDIIFMIFSGNILLAIIQLFTCRINVILGKEILLQWKAYTIDFGSYQWRFQACAVVMGMSILQGGPAPNFMATSIASYLVGSILQLAANKNKCYQTLCESVSI